MNTINKGDSCIVCQSNSLSTKIAIVSPFLAKRIWNRLPFFTHIVTCSNCGFIFFGIRLNDDEMARLYRDYRGVEYQRMRQQSEWRYTAKFNSSIGSTDTEIANRQGILINALKEIGITQINSILDFGGDKGQMIPKVYNAERYVYDISNVDLVEGVKRLTDHRQFDLIMCGNVLEHISYPLEIIRQIRQYAHKDTVLFIEVPNEINLVDKKIIVSPSFNKIRSPLSVLRPLRGRIMTEHINYFSEKSLRAMLKDNEILYLKTIKTDLGWCVANMIYCLVKIGGK